LPAISLIIIHLIGFSHTRQGFTFPAVDSVDALLAKIAKNGSDCPFGLI